MSEIDNLLAEARTYCDPNTGEVVQRIPEQLMQRLRAARLAVGIWGRNRPLGTTAKWFVFLDDDIRTRVLQNVREAKQKQRRACKRATKSPGPDSASDVTRLESPPASHGLSEFRSRRRPPHSPC